MIFDLVIKNGIIIDGSGAPAYRADIGIVEDYIAYIGTIENHDNKTVIDACGALVCPGFIDTHSHADCSVFLFPNCESYLKQGITTFIGGQCGDSNAPIYNWWMRKYWEYDMWNDVDPFILSPQTIQPVDRVVDVIYEKTGVKIHWRNFNEYVQDISKLGLGCNMIMLAGHSQIRADVMGQNQLRVPDKNEMKMMLRHIDEAFEAGVWGISTGRDYPPSAYAQWEELIELVQYVKKYDGYYFTHWRRTGPRTKTPERPNKLAGITEALEIALITGIKTQISHLTTGFDIYPSNDNMDMYSAMVTLAHIDKYIARGANVGFDVIPGTSGGICITPYLASLFMPWIKIAGSLAHFVDNLRASDYREKIISYLANGEWYPINPKANPLWDQQIHVINTNNEWDGQSIRDIANICRTPPLETLFYLLIQEPRIRIQKFEKSYSEIDTLLSHPLGFVCTDTYAVNLIGVYGIDMEIPEVQHHPHTYCAFPKYLLEHPEITIEQRIYKLTGAPASFMNIKKRGLLKEGYYADLLIIDMNKLKTNESYIEPRIYPEGIDTVIINGKFAVQHGGLTYCRSGRILSKP